MKYLLILTLFSNSFQLGAQAFESQGADSLQSQKRFINSSILPLSMLSAGVILNNSNFEKELNQNLRARMGENFEFKIDDYIMYAPILEMYLVDAFHVEAKNHWFDQTKYLVMSNVISAAITNSLKIITRKVRPDGSANDAFPSGHTTFAFTNASVLMHEFKDSAPAIAYSGYLFSGTTGLFRMLNDKHWLSDVLVGAGVGILATELVYYLEPLKNFNPFKNKQNINFVPIVNPDSQGFYFSYSF